MNIEGKFLVDVGMSGLLFPIKAISKGDPSGQSTVANISISARIMHEFGARCIDKFIKILHEHRDRIGTFTLKTNIVDYLKEFNASTVNVDFDYPFFIEKNTPVSNNKCLVNYSCRYSAKINASDKIPKIIFKINVPVITSYPVSDAKKEGGLLAQTSILDIEVESNTEIYPEDLVEITDRYALAPVYSYLSEEDQLYIIDKVHSQNITSVAMIDNIKNSLAHNRDINWYNLECRNFGILHTYNTLIRTEKSIWVPFSGYDE